MDLMLFLASLDEKENQVVTTRVVLRQLECSAVNLDARAQRIAIFVAWGQISPQAAPGLEQLVAALGSGHQQREPERQILSGLQAKLPVHVWHPQTGHLRCVVPWLPSGGSGWCVLHGHLGRRSWGNVWGQAPELHSQ